VERFPRKLGNGIGGGFYFAEGRFCERFAGLGFGLRMAGFAGSGAVSGYEDSGFWLLAFGFWILDIGLGSGLGN